MTWHRFHRHPRIDCPRCEWAYAEATLRALRRYDIRTGYNTSGSVCQPQQFTVGEKGPERILLHVDAKTISEHVVADINRRAQS